MKPTTDRPNRLAHYKGVTLTLVVALGLTMTACDTSSTELTPSEKLCADNWETISHSEMLRMKEDRSIDGIYEWSGGYWVSYNKIMDICLQHPDESLVDQITTTTTATTAARSSTTADPEDVEALERIAGCDRQVNNLLTMGSYIEPLADEALVSLFGDDMAAAQVAYDAYIVQVEATAALYELTVEECEALMTYLDPDTTTLWAGIHAGVDATAQAKDYVVEACREQLAAFGFAC